LTGKRVSRELPVTFQKLKEYDVNDTRFMAVRIWILHTGLNHNGSIFTKETVDKNLHTLANTPVLAFIEENSEGEIDFSDHRMVLERNSEGEFNFRYLGQSIGVIPESHNAHWETKAGDDGVVREYLVCDALIWTKWDEPIEIFNREGKTWQSMELSQNYTGNWDKDGNFVFESFEFNGACLLSNVDTLPAMENSTAELVYTKSTTDHMFSEIKEKLDMFNKAFSKPNEEGGEEMTEEIKQEELIESKEENFETIDEAVVTETIVDEVQTEDIVEEFDYKSEYEKIKGDFNTLTENFTKLEDEVKGLREFKELKVTQERVEKETVLFDSFSAELTEDEMQPLKDSVSEYSLEQLEEKLFTLVGKKKATFSKQPKKEKQTVKIEVEHVEVEEKAYGGLFDKYSK
jgi:hypothetical protein